MVVVGHRRPVQCGNEEFGMPCGSVDEHITSDIGRVHSSKFKDVLQQQKQDSTVMWPYVATCCNYLCNNVPEIRNS